MIRTPHVRGTRGPAQSPAGPGAYRWLLAGALLLGGVWPAAPDAAASGLWNSRAASPAPAAVSATPPQHGTAPAARPEAGDNPEAARPAATNPGTVLRPVPVSVAMQPTPGAATATPQPATSEAQPEQEAASAGPVSETGGVDGQPADDGWDFEEEDDGWGFEDEEEDDGWGFEDEEGDDAWTFADDEADTETWGTLLRDQAVDIGFFTGFAALVLVGFFRKSVPLKYVTLAAAVAYMGFTKSQLISVVNVYGLVTGNMPVFRYSLAWYLFAAFTVVTTVLWGRLYCGRVCAFGALTQLMDRVVPARLRVEVPAWLEQRAAWIKYGLLVAVLLYFLATADIPAYRWVEPFWMFTRRGTTAMWIALAVLLVATVFVRNLYCRFLCPVGAFLGVLSKATVFRIKRWKECDTCKICEKACEWGAIQGPRIDMTECVRCDDCERLYADVKKCPHWLLLLRAKRRQRQAAPSVIPVRPVAST